MPRRINLLLVRLGLLALMPCLLLVEAEAQSSTSVREEMYRRYLEFPSYVKGGKIEPHWEQDGSSFWYAESDDPGALFWRVDPKRNAKTRIAEPAEQSGAKREMQGWPSPDGEWTAFKRDFNLFLRSSDGEQTIQLTEDGTEKIRWIGYSGQLVWAPDGSKLAARRDDYTDVPCYPLLDWLQSPVPVKCQQDTVTGQLWPRTELFIFDVETRSRAQIQLSPESYLDYVKQPYWREDGSEFIATIRNRSGALSQVVAANVSTGRTRRLLEDSKVARGRGPARKLLLPVGDDTGLIWLSERDDWNHIYLYDYDGNLVRRLTQGNFPVLDVVEIDAERKWVYFTAHDDRARPYDTHLCRVSLDGGGYERLTEAEGDHQVVFSPSKEFYLDTHSSITRPPVVELRQADGKLLQVLSEADVSGLKQLRRVPPEEFVVKAADSETDLYGVLYKPYDFDPDRKYPVIDFIYGGPSSVDIQRAFVPWQWKGQSWAVPEAFAQLGYITFAVENRGTPERGRKFHEPYPGQMGHHEVPDHVAALRQLAEERPYIDMDRVGIHGWSSGGQYATRALLQTPDVYHVAVALAPASDLFHTPGYAEELFLGMPQDNKEAYEYASNLWLADQLQGKLLIIQGTHDTSVLLSEVMRMIDALIKADKRFDLILLPGETHFPSKAVQPYIEKAIREYFAEHLKP